MNKIIMAIPKFPDELQNDFDARFQWYMERFGKSLGVELACHAFSLIDKHQEKREIGDDIIFSFEISSRVMKNE
jgi:hypothetical protein